MVFNLQQCPLRKNITLQATQPCMRMGARRHREDTGAQVVHVSPSCI